MQVRLRSSLTDAQQAKAISWIRQAIRMPMFRSAYHGTYTITGVPVVINDLASQITGSIAGLLIAAVLVMAATLLLVFRNRFRLLPLAVALAATGITFGLLALLGATLTMASIAVLPILIGLGVDYGIQFQARAQEARMIAEREGGAPISAAQAVGQAAARSAPAIATAALATGTGFPRPAAARRCRWSAGSGCSPRGRDRGGLGLPVRVDGRVGGADPRRARRRLAGRVVAGRRWAHRPGRPRRG